MSILSFLQAHFSDVGKCRVDACRLVPEVREDVCRIRIGSLHTERHGQLCRLVPERGTAFVDLGDAL